MGERDNQFSSVPIGSVAIQHASGMNKIGVAQHGQLGRSRGARGPQHDSHIFRFAIPEFFYEKIRLLIVQFFSQFEQLAESD
jgi:hypothetical protein